MTYHDEIKAFPSLQTRLRAKHLQVLLEVHDNLSMGSKPCVDCGTIINNWPVDVPAICDQCLEERRLW